jgi:hypothetical protein
LLLPHDDRHAELPPARLITVNALPDATRGKAPETTRSPRARLSSSANCGAFRVTGIMTALPGEPARARLEEAGVKFDFFD